MLGSQGVASPFLSCSMAAEERKEELSVRTLVSSEYVSGVLYVARSADAAAASTVPEVMR